MRQSAHVVGISGRFDLATLKQGLDVGIVKWGSHSSLNTEIQNVSLGKESLTRKPLLSQSTREKGFSPVIVNANTPTVSIRSILKSPSLLVK